jgi:hypothetical protein
MNPKPLLRLEGVAMCALSVAAYRFSHGGWWLFVLLCLAPDFSMVAYAFNARVRAACYNAVHTYTAPVLLAVFGHLGGKAGGCFGRLHLDCPYRFRSDARFRS